MCYYQGLKLGDSIDVKLVCRIQKTNDGQKACRCTFNGNRYKYIWFSQRPVPKGLTAPKHIVGTVCNSCPCRLKYDAVICEVCKLALCKDCTKTFTGKKTPPTITCYKCHARDTTPSDYIHTVYNVEKDKFEQMDADDICFNN